MCALNFTATDMDGGYYNFVRRYLFHQEAETDHIGNGIHSSDFVEVDLGDIPAVGFALSLCDKFINGNSV